MTSSLATPVATVYDMRTAAPKEKGLTAAELSGYGRGASLAAWTRPIELAGDTCTKSAKLYEYAGTFVLTGGWRKLGHRSATVNGFIVVYDEWTKEEKHIPARVSMTNIPAAEKRPERVMLSLAM